MDALITFDDVVAAFKQMFEFYDKDKNGRLEGEELVQLTRFFLRMGNQNPDTLSAEELAEARAEVLRLFDANNDSLVSPSEWINAWASITKMTPESVSSLQKTKREYLSGLHEQFPEIFPSV
eukprot:gnl/Spiro4/23920_TR11842_c0_g1_i1.p1 gnl/Spiro4/23920_TR11842_c0_g1~~gnl/Spiro4/23920_TR11842_c0_g1_i1.p1  ORF type:complete len:122 (-),score=23.24 gnl/Spiro4/23920_TR11842_c0_g1_i1:18-383(-)